MERTVKTISGLLDAIDELASGYFSSPMKSELIFRGLSRYEYGLLPGVYRSYRESGDTRMIYGGATENEILHHFIKNAMSLVDHIDKDDLLTWLTYAQHFGAPTRLLDFSSNPLISLYFCCKKEAGMDGAVCVLHEKNYVHSLKLDRVKGRTKRDVLGEIIANIVDPEQGCTSYPVTFIPHYIDNRMEAQASRFLVWGRDKRPFEEIAESHGSMMEGNPGAYFCKIRIDGGAKHSLLRELSFLGVNEKKMFPGLDGIGKYISEYYRVGGEPE